VPSASASYNKHSQNADAIASTVVARLRLSFASAPPGSAPGVGFLVARVPSFSPLSALAVVRRARAVFDLAGQKTLAQNRSPRLAPPPAGCSASLRACRHCPCPCGGPEGAATGHRCRCWLPWSPAATPAPTHGHDVGGFAPRRPPKNDHGRRSALPTNGRKKQPGGGYKKDRSKKGSPARAPRVRTLRIPGRVSSPTRPACRQEGGAAPAHSNVMHLSYLHPVIQTLRAYSYASLPSVFILAVAFFTCSP